MSMASMRDAARAANANSLECFTAGLLRHVAAVGRCVAAAFLLAANSADGASAQVMTLPGKFGVSATGAASYTIPIAVPPGTAGVAPTLSLDYSSQQGDGILGLGWSLSGFPAVGRCPQTVAQDGVSGSINYDANDRFCLDGQRLVAVSGSYGADGAEYRTEIDGFARIISHGTAGTGPAWFEVRTKSGQIMEFGHSTDSQVLVHGQSTVRTWGVNKVSDTKGNYLTVSYTSDAANGQSYLGRIDYTGNAGAGLQPYNSVQFVYETRPDITPLYHAGSLVQMTQRLTNVKTYAGAALVGDYRVAYVQENYTTTLPLPPPFNIQVLSKVPRSRIASVTACGGDNACLPPTTFTWQGQIIPPGTAASVIADNFPSPTIGDFNGDGKSDVLASTGFDFRLYLAGENGQLAPTSTTVGSTLQTVALTGDWNGDGKTDAAVCIPPQLLGGCTFYRSTGSAFVSMGFTTPSSTDLYLGDWNGDGRTDLIVCPTGDPPAVCNLFYGNETGFSTGGVTPAWGNQKVITGDFNADGKTDVLVCPKTDGAVCSLYFSSGTGFVQGNANHNVNIIGFEFSLPPNWGNRIAFAADFNGDGKTDVVACTSDGQCNFYYYTGTGFARGNFAPNWADRRVTPGDFNLDGRTDLLDCPSTDGDCFVWYSTGVDFALGNFFAPWGGDEIQTADWAGTGAAGVLRLPRDNNGTVNGPIEQYITTYSPELIVSIGNGLGATTAISYQPITKNTVYTNDANAVYPLQDVQGAMYVVSRVDSSNGLGGTLSSSYQYAGAKRDLSGRGFLGFRQVRVTDLQTNVVQTTNYRQDFPFLGLIASQTKVLGPQTLSQTLNEYQLTNASGGATISTPNLLNAPYRVAPSQEAVNSWDLDGSVTPSVTTSYQYDAFGNATQITVSMSDGYTKTTSNTYANDTVNWLLGRLTGATVAGVFDPPPPPPPPPTNVSIQSSTNNLDLWNYLVANGVATPGTPGSWNVTIVSGVVIASTSTSVPAFDTGTFPSGSTVQIVNNGTIVGAGGSAGAGGTCTQAAAAAGASGGLAMRAQSPVTFTNNGGIWGGGGGGGGGQAQSVFLGFFTVFLGGGGGGGGAGSNPGAGAAGGDGFSTGSSGSAGTISSGGAGGPGGSYLGLGNAGAGGPGGGPGQAGSAGGTGNCGAGVGGAGAAGAAVNGNSLITWIVEGDRRGAVN